MAMTFNGNGDRVDIPSWSAYQLVTCSLWVNFNTVATGLQRMVGSNNLYEVRLSGNNGVFLNEFWQGSNAPASTTNPVVGQWYHVVCTSDGNANFGEIYVNGVLEDTSTGQTGTSGGTTMSLGNRSGASASQGLDGQLDDVRFYDRILVPDEIETIYNCRGKDGIVYGLRNRWTLSESHPGAVASGTGTIKDWAANGQHGNVIGTPDYTESQLCFSRGVK